MNEDPIIEQANNVKKIKSKSEDLYDELWVFPSLDTPGVIFRWLMGTISLIIFGTLANVSLNPTEAFATFIYLLKSWLPLSIILLLLFGYGSRWLKQANIILSWIAWIVCTITISFVMSAFLSDGDIFITWTLLFKNLLRDVFFIFLLLYFFDGEHRRGSISWAKAKIDTLQARMHPHFLFNILNNLAEMAYDEDRETLEEAILDLADLTRAMIGHKPFVSSEVEKNTAMAYIKLQMIRFDERLSVNWNWKIEDDLEMPSLLLQPLIENSIKYGIEPVNKLRTVQINGWTDEKNVFIQIINPYYPNNDVKKGNGITLANIKERLRWMYNNKQYFFVKRTEDQFIVEIKLPKIKYIKEKEL